MNCPNCGAGLKIQNDKAVCEYCGYEELITDANRDDFFNMIVSNESAGNDTITISIPECNVGFIIRSGEVIAKDIPPGYHTIVVSCEGMTEYRSVLIPSDGKATKVYVSRAVMGIGIRIVEPGGVNRYGSAGTGTRNMSPETALPIMALVLSILFPVVGLIMAIVDTASRKNQGLEMHKYTKVAFIIFGVRMALWFLLIIASLTGSILLN